MTLARDQVNVSASGTITVEEVGTFDVTLVVNGILTVTTREAPTVDRTYVEDGTLTVVEGGTGFAIATPLDFAVVEPVTNPPEFVANLVSEGDTAVQADDYLQIEIDGVVYDSDPVTQEQIDGAGFSLEFPDFDASTPGVGTYDDVRLRVVRSLGPDVVSDWTAVIAEFDVTDVPAAFTIGMWSVADLETSGDARVTITSLPSDNGSALTAINYRINAGGAVSSGITTTGTFDIAGLTDDVEVTIELQAVNAVGGGAWSDDKTVTPTSGVVAMARGITVLGNAPSASTSTSTGAGTLGMVEANNGDLYWVHIDSNSDVVYVKSTDGGETWGSAVVLLTGTSASVSVWFDRWSGIAAGKIHVIYISNNDVFYRSIDTENSDTLTAATTVFDGASSASGCAMSITRARGGNLYAKVMIDAGAEGGFFRSVDGGANWTSRTDSEALAASDQWALVPGFAADNQDIMCIFMDASASEISRCIYDDSGNSWAETSIATSITALAASTAYPNFAVAVDLANSQIVLAVWTAADALNADLLCFTVTESAITPKTDVITNSTDDQGLVAIGIDTDSGDWDVFYFGASDGADNFTSQITVRHRVSTDDGATWSSATVVLPRLNTAFGLWMTPRFATDMVAVVHSIGTYQTVIYERT